MRNLILLMLYLITTCAFINAQDIDIWEKTPLQGIKIYFIHFENANEGWADSYIGNILITSDGGKNWSYASANKVKLFKEEIQEDSQNSWSVEIYCSVLKSDDGGVTWVAYNKKEEHICSVYFKDKNTGWKVASEFLSNVVNTLKEYLKEDSWEARIGKSHKCTEYYTDTNSGWSVGWCFKNLEIL